MSPYHTMISRHGQIEPFNLNSNEIISERESQKKASRPSLRSRSSSLYFLKHGWDVLSSLAMSPSRFARSLFNKLTKAITTARKTCVGEL